MEKSPFFILFRFRVVLYSIMEVGECTVQRCPLLTELFCSFQEGDNPSFTLSSTPSEPFQLNENQSNHDSVDVI